MGAHLLPLPSLLPRAWLLVPLLLASSRFSLPGEADPNDALLACFSSLVSRGSVAHGFL